MIGYKYTKTMSISSHFTPFGIYPSNVFLKCNKPLYFCIKNDDDMEWIFFMIVYVIFSICTNKNRKMTWRQFCRNMKSYFMPIFICRTMRKTIIALSCYCQEHISMDGENMKKIYYLLNGRS